jgi:hypothetical protein
MNERKSLTRIIQEVGVAVGVDPRTVARYLRGEPIREMHRSAVAGKCKKRGLKVAAKKP